jgi:hypothetical protein
LEINTGKFMVTVDGKRVIHVAPLMVKNDQEARLDVAIEDTVLRFSFLFTAGTEQDGRWSPVEDRIRFELTGWGKPLGASTSEPNKVGEVGSKKLYFQLVNFGIGEMNIAQFFLLVEDGQ